MTDLPRRTLGGTGLALTEFGFGCAGIAGLFQPCPPDQARATLTTAWDAGIRYFDTAPFYGNGLSEQRLGDFLSGKPREAFVVSTKAGRLLTPVARGAAPDNGFAGAPSALVHFDYSHDGILRSVEGSLARLQTNRIDILYVHDIGDFAHGPEQGTRHMADLTGTGIVALNRLKAEGVIGAWGLGVNEIPVCLTMLAQGPLDVILLAGRYTLLDRRAEAELLALCHAKGVPLVIGGVLNSGILATGAMAGARFDYEAAPPDILTRVEAMDHLCVAAGSSLLSAALNFPLGNPSVASVLIGASDPASLCQSLTVAQQRPAVHLYQDTALHSLC